MKLHYFLLAVWGINCSCNNTTSNFMSIQISHTFKLPGIASSKTIYVDEGKVYYQSMDEPGKETFKCFSLKQNQLTWSVGINVMGINKGAITSNGEYIVPTLSDSVYLVDSAGNYRILKLEDRCKINPLIYENTFILQDRGVGLKSFDAKTLQEVWIIKQNDNLTMSQPILLNRSIVYVLDDKSIQSSDAASGKLNWRIPITDTFALHDLYGSYEDLIFILSISLNKEKRITAINENGKIVWQMVVDSTVNGWERDMVANNNKLFCRGDSSIFVYSLNDGRTLQRYSYQSAIVTNLVVDKYGNVIFGLDNNSLVKINNNNGKDLLAVTFKSKPEQLLSVSDDIFLYSYPNLYQLDVPK